MLEELTVYTHGDCKMLTILTMFLDDQAMPGVLRFGKRGQSFVRFGRDVFDKKDMPGVLRFGKRADGEQEKKNVPGK